MRPVRVLAAIVFWVSASLLTFAQVGYPLALWLRERLLRGSAEGDAPVPPSATDAGLPSVTLIVAAYREADVIAAKVANARALDYPQDRLSVVVSCDGSPDDTAARARAAGADLVLENPRGGKIASQDAAVARASDRRRGVLRRQRAVGARRPAPSGRPVRRPAGGLRLRATSPSPAIRATRPRPTRRASTGATRCGCGRWSPGCTR